MQISKTFPKLKQSLLEMGNFLHKEEDGVQEANGADVQAACGTRGNIYCDGCREFLTLAEEEKNMYRRECVKCRTAFDLMNVLQSIRLELVLLGLVAPCGPEIGQK